MNDGTNASSFLLYVNDGADDDKNEMITSHPILFRLNYCFIDKDYSDDTFHLLTRCIAISVRYTCRAFSNA